MVKLKGRHAVYMTVVCVGVVRSRGLASVSGNLESLHN
jgi:hypothetical protein